MNCFPKKNFTFNFFFLKEIHAISKVNHKHCQQIIGVCIHKTVRIVTKLAEFGSIKHFFVHHRKEVNERMLLTWCQQIADGMAYLQDMNIVHGNLAARNVLVETYNHIRLTDFGLLSLTITENNPYVLPEAILAPKKWMSIESQKSSVFNHKTDVWSFGVCAWEIFTFGLKPYFELESSFLLKHLETGMRLRRPQIVHNDVYVLLLRCWRVEPEQRPSFKDLERKFAKHVTNPLA